MTTKDEVKELLAKMRDDHYEAKENAVGDIQEQYHETASATLQAAIIRIEDNIQENNE